MIARKHSTTAYIAAVDGLRAIAILAVFIFHLQSSWLPGGLAGVDIFFVISGFVVTRSMMSRSHAGFAAMMTDFYARRFQRIMPPLVVMLLATSMAYCLVVPDAWLSGTIKSLESTMARHAYMPMFLEEAALYAGGSNVGSRAKAFAELIFKLSSGSAKARFGDIGQPTERFVYSMTTNSPVAVVLGSQPGTAHGALRSTYDHSTGPRPSLRYL
jgi:hypothetical protein